MINATLILVAICLFLGLKLAGTVERVAGRLSDNLAAAAPLRGEVAAMTDELRGLRADLSTLTAEPGILADRGAEALSGQIAALDGRLETAMERVDEIGVRIGAVAEDPAILMDRAVRAATDQAAQGLAGLAGCALPVPEVPELPVPEKGS